MTACRRDRMTTPILEEAWEPNRERPETIGAVRVPTVALMG